MDSSSECGLWRIWWEILAFLIADFRVLATQSTYWDMFEISSETPEDEIIGASYSEDV